MNSSINNSIDKVKNKVNSSGLRDVVGNEQLEEGKLTSTIESQTSKLPSISWLTLAVGSMIASAGLAIFSPRKEFANFVGLWAPSFLLIGLYNKMVKLHELEDAPGERRGSGRLATDGGYH